ncbi:MAG: hypothetical protein KA354_01120 [Phycisphaerae bacterium]|nr:hypothetical protein [Phycisphaerae bacterium]
MVGRASLWLTIVTCGLLAAPAALPGALDHRKGEFDLAEWLPVFLCFWVASAALLVSTARVFGRSTPAWSRIAAAMAMAALVPLAVEETQHHLQAAAAFVVTALAVWAGLATGWWLRTPLGFVFTAASCGLDATGFVWPLGVLCAGTRRGGPFVRGVGLLIAGSLGCIAGRLIGLPALTGYSHDGVAYALHRDLLLCLPVVVLGAAGLARCRRSDDEGSVRALTGCAAISLLAILPIVLGFPLNVRLVVLAVWWFAPLGMTDAADMLSRRRERPAIEAMLGALSILAVLGLSWPGVSAWFNAVLLAGAAWMSPF